MEECLATLLCGGDTIDSKTSPRKGGDQGGIQWGTAYDGDRIYAAITNQANTPYRLTPSGELVTGGSWAALAPDTGEILWQTGDPAGAYDLAPLTSANGVV